MSRMSVQASFLLAGVLAAGIATAGEPDEFRLRYFGADIEREGGRRDGPVVKVHFGTGSKLNDQAIAALKDFTGLRHLNLAGRSIRPGLFDALRSMKDLEVLNLPIDPRDDEFAVVAGLPKLRELWVVTVGYAPGVTDNGVKAVSDLKEMRKLRLWSNKVTDAGLKHITGLTKLTELELVETKITDASMPLVATFADLERLDLTFTQVTPAGLRQLKGLKKLKELRAGAGSKEEIAAAFTDLGLQHLLPKEPDGKLPPRPATGIVSDDVAKLQANWSGVQIYRDSLSIDGSSPGKLLPGYFGDHQMGAIAQVRGMKSLTLTRAPLVTVWVDFRGIQDEYMRGKSIDYFENSRRATYVQQQYAIRNPGQFEDYGENCWGITVSDGPGPETRPIKGKERQFFGYLARGVPDGPDDGTIAPWAVVASLPIAPAIVLSVLRWFDDLKLREAGPYGFKATFNPTYAKKSAQAPLWVSPFHLGLNQGPIVLMMENYRSGLLWRLMRQCPYLVSGLRRAGFSGGWLGTAQGVIDTSPAKVGKR